jgi:cell division protein FtsL
MRLVMMMMIAVAVVVVVMQHETRARLKPAMTSHRSRCKPNLTSSS